jgi:hypothetical protein
MVFSVQWTLRRYFFLFNTDISSILFLKQIFFFTPNCEMIFSQFSSRTAELWFSIHFPSIFLHKFPWGRVGRGGGEQDHRSSIEIKKKGDEFPLFSLFVLPNQCLLSLLSRIYWHNFFPAKNCAANQHVVVAKLTAKISSFLVSIFCGIGKYLFWYCCQQCEHKTDHALQFLIIHLQYRIQFENLTFCSSDDLYTVKLLL